MINKTPLNSQKGLALTAAATVALGLGACGKEDKTDTLKGDGVTIQTTAPNDKLTPTGTTSDSRNTSDSGSRTIFESGLIKSGSSSIAWESQFVAALNTHGIKISASGRAKTKKVSTSDLGAGSSDQPTQLLKLGVSRGLLEYFEPGTTDSHIRGVLKHNKNRIKLVTGSGDALTASDPKINLARGQLSATLSAAGGIKIKNMTLFTIDTSTAQPLRFSKDKKFAALDGSTLKLSSEAATLIGQALKSEEFKADDLVGTLKIIVPTS